MWFTGDSGSIWIDVAVGDWIVGTMGGGAYALYRGILYWL